MNDQTQNAWKKERKRLKTPIFHGTPSVGVAGIFCSGIFVAGMLRGWGAEDGDPWKILPDGGWRWPPGTRPRPPLAGGGRGDTQHPVPPPRCHPGGAERPRGHMVPDPGGKMGVVAVNYLPGGELITVCAPLFKGLVIN